MVRSKSTTKSTRGCRVRLDPNTFQRLVVEIIVGVYGSTPVRPLAYGIDDEALCTLREASQGFLENMWEQVKTISRQQNRVTVVRKDFDRWKHVNQFKLKYKRPTKGGRSLCDMFEEVKRNKQSQHGRQILAL